MDARGAPAPELRPLGIGEVLDVSIKIFTRNAVTFFKTVAVVVVPVQILLIFVLSSVLPDSRLLQPSFGSTPEDPFAGFQNYDAAQIGASVAAVLVLVVATVVATTLATAACFKGVSDAYLGARPSWRDSLGYARSRVLSLIWISILAGLLIIVPAALVFVITFLLLGTATEAIAIFILGGLAVFVLAIYFGIAFLTATPVLLFEGVKGRRALARSVRLVRGRWWPTFGAIFLGFLLAGVVSGVINGVFAALLITSAGDSVFGAVTLNQVSTALASIVATPFQAAMTAVIYFDLRVRKEGFDLELLSRRVGVTPTEGAGLGVATAPPPGAGPPPTGWSGPAPGGGPPPTGPGWSGPAPAGGGPAGQPPPPPAPPRPE
jgi:hypothetical protein